MRAGPGLLGTSYADALAAVGLHPDNPDGMYAQLMSYIQNPVAFKNADPNWPGARDDKIWWDDGTGRIALQWPFMGGKWLDAAPIGWNDAKLRAVFKVPAGTGTKDYLAKLYRVTGADANKPFFLQSHTLTHGGGIDVGKAINDVGKSLGDAANVVSSVLPGVLPGSNLLAALVTGKDPIEALKKDVSAFADDASLAMAVSSGNWPAVGANLAAKAQKLGIQLPSAAVQAAVAVAQNGGDPSAIASAAMGPDAWNAATNYGSILTDLKPPPGLSYKPDAKAAPAAGTHPITAAVQKKLTLHLGSSAAAAVKAVPHAAVQMHLGGKKVTSPYGPYPKSGAVHGLGLGRPGGGQGGRPHAAPLRRGRPMRRGFGWNADGTWWYPWPYEPADAGSCTEWGDPVEMSPPMQTVGEVQLRNSGGQPAAVRCADGTVYLFAVEGGELTMRPCAAAASTLGAASEPLYYLYRSTVPVGGWAIVGGWYSVDDAQDEMTSVLKSAPTAALGAYVWDGQAMHWQPLS